MHEVEIFPSPISKLRPFIGESRMDALVGVEQSVRVQMGSRTLWHVSSTAVGGGVAEMLPMLLGYAAGGGIRTRWLIVDGDPEFFGITKQLHVLWHHEATPLGVARCRSGRVEARETLGTTAM